MSREHQMVVAILRLAANDEPITADRVWDLIEIEGGEFRPRSYEVMFRQSIRWMQALLSLDEYSRDLLWDGVNNAQINMGVPRRDDGRGGQGDGSRGLDDGRDGPGGGYALLIAHSTLFSSTDEELAEIKNSI